MQCEFLSTLSCWYTSSNFSSLVRRSMALRVSRPFASTCSFKLGVVGGNWGDVSHIYLHSGTSRTLIAIN